MSKRTRKEQRQQERERRRDRRSKERQQNVPPPTWSTGHLERRAHPHGPPLGYEGADLIVDLHGMTVQEGCEAMNAALAQAEVEHLRLKIIHGYSHGHVLRDEVRKWLGRSKRYRSLVRLDPSNEGVTLVLIG